jgi:hypothetical protein
MELRLKKSFNMERQITPEQFEKVRIHMRDTYDVAEHEWDEEELIEAW